MEKERQPIVDCIIPAKGRSVRFPGKNKAEIDGVPILGKVIDAAKASGIFRDVYVSTDDGDIATIATNYKALLHFRPLWLAEDDVPVYEVVKAWQSDLDFQQVFDNTPPAGYVGIIHPTAWGLLPSDIQAMWNKLTGHNALISSAYRGAQGIMATVRPFEHPDGALEMVDGKWLRLHNIDHLPDGKLKRDQDMPELEMDAGYCYIYPVVHFLAYGFYPERLLGYSLPRGRVVDINVEEDILIARKLARGMEKWKS